jgi:hypothetical protein
MGVIFEIAQMNNYLHQRIPLSKRVGKTQVGMEGDQILQNIGLVLQKDR